MMNPSPSLFCDECGAANLDTVTHCFSCGLPLNTSTGNAGGGNRTSSTQTSLQIPATTTALSITSTESVPDGPLPTGFLLARRYRIVSQVGQGGFGMVYKARDKRHFNRLVAVKQITLSQLTARQMIDATNSYNREVALLPLLKHAHLPRFYDHFVDAKNWYLVMDFIQGETLEDYVKHKKNGTLSTKEVLSIAIQLCGVLRYLHTKHAIIFRDVKPANIMRTRKGKLYLIDFGIARRYVAGKKDTMPLGSPGYAAPEQYGKARTTLRTDIYGLGVTMKTLLTGQDPTDDDAVLPAVQRKPVPKKVQKLLDQMQEWDASKRPKSITEVHWRCRLARDGIVGVAAQYGLAFTTGLAIGSLPYTFPFTLSHIAAISVHFVYGWPTQLLCFYLLGIVALFIYGIVLAVTSAIISYRRYVGFGILCMFCFFLVDLFTGWLPFTH